ncbi:MAG: Holliday junction branch migration DNA helicase RuvB [bacterium]|nr:Holliday junction branch migration DNA helicase RuvB [bacterium]
MDTDISEKTGIASLNIEDENLEKPIRPKTLSEFTSEGLGQVGAVENLSILVEAAKQRLSPIDHVLFYGPPGLGKTTLAHTLGNEMGVSVRVTSGAAITKVGDLAAILSNLGENDILFVDEIHRLSKPVEEVLYPAMEDFALDIVIGKGPSARTIRLDLPKFTLIGATTRLGMLSNPLRDRFGMTLRLEYYSNEELERIILRASKLFGIDVNAEVVNEIGKRSRGTPRIAIKLLKRVRDFGEVKNAGVFEKDIAIQALNLAGIDDNGLDSEDKRYLSAIIEKFGGGPVGIKTISAAISEDVETIEDVVEPYLIQIGFIKRTAQGRQTTPAALNYFNQN